MLIFRSEKKICTKVTPGFWGVTKEDLKTDL